MPLALEVNLHQITLKRAGSFLGPVLFSNDLPDNAKSSVRLFADDCVLCSSIRSLQDCLILQEDLESFFFALCKLGGRLANEA